MFDMQKIGERIARLRRERDLTQAELAEHLGISYQAVSSWERGATMPDISKLVELSRALGTTVDALLTGEEREAPAAEMEAMPEETEKTADAPKKTADEDAAAQETETSQEEAFESFGGSLQELMARMKEQLGGQMQLVCDKLITLKKKKTDDGIAFVVSSEDKKQKSRGKVRTETISAMAGNMDQELLEDVLVDAINDEDEDLVEEIACYLEPETIEHAMERADESLTNEMMGTLAMHMGSDALEECALRALHEDDEEMMEEIAFHLDEEELERALKRCEEKMSAEMVEVLVCYASETAIDLIIEKCDLDDEDTIEALSPYLNQRQMRVLLKKLRNG